MKDSRAEVGCKQWLVNFAWIAAILGALGYATFTSWELSQTRHAHRMALREIAKSPEIQQDGKMVQRIDEFLDSDPGDVIALSVELRLINEQLKTEELRQEPESEPGPKQDEGRNE